MAALGYFVLGVAAGMCNEHVGPTLLAVPRSSSRVWLWRKQRRHLALRLVPDAPARSSATRSLFFAPGQGQRYEGLAEHYSVLQQINVRGIAGNIDIFIDRSDAQLRRC